MHDFRILLIWRNLLTLNFILRKKTNQLQVSANRMAAIKFTDTWILEDYANVFESNKMGQFKQSPPLAASKHWAFPGLSWQIRFYPHGDSFGKPDHSSMFINATFGPEDQKRGVPHVWAVWTVTIVAGDANNNLKATSSRHEYSPGHPGWGFMNAFPQEAVKLAARPLGHLEIKFDLTLFKIVDLLKCRDTVRELLSNARYTNVKVGGVIGKIYEAHMAVLAKRCSAYTGGLYVDAKPIAFEAFLSAVYFDNFEFLSNWELAVGVLRIANAYGAADLKAMCDDALAELIPTVSVANLLQILPEAIRCGAPVSKAVGVRCLAEKKDVWSLPEWSDFKEHVDKNIMSAVCDALLENRWAVSSTTPVFHAVEIKLNHTWKIANAVLLKAILPQPTFVTSPDLLQHKAFPNLKWQLEFHPRGNVGDPGYTPGFASLYLKVIFGPKNDDLKSVYAKWNASITMKDGTPVSIPVSPDFVLYAGAKEMKFGYANAFQFEQYNEAVEPNKDISLEIRLDLTIASIPEILKCRELISSLHSDKTHADVKIDVNGTIIKAHKFILAVRSSVFSRMFEPHTEESKTGIVPMNDTSPEAFKSFLAAVYYASWDFLSDMDATIDVLKLAEKYAVTDLKSYCDEALSHFATEANVLTILQHAAIHNAELAKAACVEILFANPELMKSDPWIKFKKVNMVIMADIAETLGELYRKERKRKREDD